MRTKQSFGSVYLYLTKTIKDVFYERVEEKELSRNCSFFGNKKKQNKGLCPPKAKHCSNIPVVCLWVFDWKRFMSQHVCTAWVCVQNVLFPIRSPCWRRGNIRCSESFAEIQTLLQQKRRLGQRRNVSWIATKMMIKMIPHTSPIILNILAFFEASMAVAESPAPLADCAFKKQKVS